MVLQRRKAQWIMVARYLLLSTHPVNNEAFIQLFVSGTDFNVDVMSTAGLAFYLIVVLIVGSSPIRIIQFYYNRAFDCVAVLPLSVMLFF